LALYFIALPLNEKVDESIRKIQWEFSTRYESSRQLKIPPHITLIPPFESENSFLEGLKVLIESVCLHQPTLSIRLNGFGTFREKVVYAGVEKTVELIQLQEKIQTKMVEQLGFKKKSYFNDFTPHVTVANRDLTPENFQKAKKEFMDRPFHATFIAHHILIYIYEQGVWKLFQHFSLKTR
jgi:2'-5' RNA ligase